MNSIEDLTVYGKSQELFYNSYKMIVQNPKLYYEYAFRDQLKRSTLSVILNITEGFATSKKRFAHYLAISIGSANETIVLLKIIGQLFSIDTSKLQDEYLVLIKQLHALRKKLKAYS